MVKCSGLDPGFTLPDQKCDAKRPCTTCVNWDKGTECAYEQPRPVGTDALSVPPDNASGYLNARTSSFQTSADGLPFREPPIDPPPDHPAPARPGPYESASPPSLSSAPYMRRPSRPTPRLPQDPPPFLRNSTVPRPSSSPVIHEIMERDSSPVGPPFTIPISIQFRTIPRPLRTSLSFAPPERVQVSCVSRSDLDMT